MLYLPVRGIEWTVAANIVGANPEVFRFSVYKSVTMTPPMIEIGVETFPITHILVGGELLRVPIKSD